MSSTLPDKICQGCGLYWQPDYKFCPYCGMILARIRYFVKDDKNSNYIDINSPPIKLYDEVKTYYPDCPHIELKFNEDTKKFIPYCTKDNEWLCLRNKKCWRCYCKGDNEL